MSAIAWAILAALAFCAVIFIRARFDPPRDPLRDVFGEDEL